MRIEELDAELETLRAEVAHMVGNIVDLTSLACYETLSRVDLDDRELWSREVRAAVDRADELVADMELLRALVRRADEARASLPRFRNQAAIAKIAEMLHGPSIVRTRHVVPLENRGLFSSSEREVRVTPKQLQTEMEHAFAATKPTLLAVESAWSTYGPLVGDFLVEAENGMKVALRHGGEVPKPITQFLHQARQAKIDLDRAPLRLNDSLIEFLGTYSKAAKKSLSALLKREQQLRKEVSRARGRAETLLRLDAECKEYSSQVPSLSYMPLASEAILAALSELHNAEKSVERGDWSAAEAARERFQSHYRAIIGSLRAEHHRLEVAAEARGALRERWDAIQLRVRDTESTLVRDDRGLDKFAKRIGLLWKEHADDAELERLIYAYEVRFLELSHRS